MLKAVPPVMGNPRQDSAHLFTALPRPIASPANKVAHRGTMLIGRRRFHVHILCIAVAAARLNAIFFPKINWLPRACVT